MFLNDVNDSKNKQIKSTAYHVKIERPTSDKLYKQLKWTRTALIKGQHLIQLSEHSMALQAVNYQ